MKLYHTTLKENMSSILEKGLQPSKIGIVYLSEKPNSWWQGDKYMIFEVDMEDYKGKLTTFNEPDLDEILCWGSIEPSRLKVYNNLVETLKI